MMRGVLLSQAGGSTCEWWVVTGVSWTPCDGMWVAGPGPAAVDVIFALLLAGVFLGVLQLLTQRQIEPDVRLRLSFGL